MQNQDAICCEPKPRRISTGQKQRIWFSDSFPARKSNNTVSHAPAAHSPSRRPSQSSGPLPHTKHRCPLNGRRPGFSGGCRVVGAKHCGHRSRRPPTVRLCVRLDASSTLGLALLEAVLESPRHILEVAHAAGTDGLSPLSLLGPVVYSKLSVLSSSLRVVTPPG